MSPGRDHDPVKALLLDCAPQRVAVGAITLDPGLDGDLECGGAAQSPPAAANYHKVPWSMWRRTTNRRSSSAPQTTKG